MEKDKNTLVWIIVGVIVLLFVFGSFGTGGYGMMGSGSMMNMMGGGMMGFGFLFMLLFWGAIIWIVVTFINGMQTSRNERDENSEDSLDILKKRYAAGKISKKQYERMKKELE